METLEDAARVGLLTGLGGGLHQVHPALPTYLAALWRAEDPADYDSARDSAIRALAAAFAELGEWLSEVIESENAGLAYKVTSLHQRNLGAMLGYALDHQLWPLAVAITSPLEDYWNARGLNVEAYAWVDRIQAVTENPDGTPPGPESPAGALWLFMTSANASRQRRAGQLEQAQRTHRQILAMLEAQPASPLVREALSSTYHRLGMVAHDQGRLEEAVYWYSKSLTISEELGNRPGMAATYHQLGNVAELQGQLEDAGDWYRKTLAISEDLGDQAGLSATYGQLGNVARDRMRLEEAVYWYRKSLAISEELGDRPGMADSYHDLGNVARDRRQLEEAVYWYSKSLAISEELGDRPGMADSYHQLGMVAQGQRRLEEAESRYRKSLAINEELGDRPGMARAITNSARWPKTRGDWRRRRVGTASP